MAIQNSILEQLSGILYETFPLSEADFRLSRGSLKKHKFISLSYEGCQVTGKIMAKTILLFVSFLILVTLSGCGNTQEKSYPADVKSWIDKDTFTWGVSSEENQNSFIRKKVNTYCSWSKKTIVNSGIIFGLIWTIIDWFIVGILGFIVIISDLFTLRFLGAICAFIEYFIYDAIKFLAIFGIYI